MSRLAQFVSENCKQGACFDASIVDRQPDFDLSRAGGGEIKSCSEGQCGCEMSASALMSDHDGEFFVSGHTPTGRDDFFFPYDAATAGAASGNIVSIDIAPPEWFEQSDLAELRRNARASHGWRVMKATYRDPTTGLLLRDPPPILLRLLKDPRTPRRLFKVLVRTQATGPNLLKNLNPLTKVYNLIETEIELINEFNRSCDDRFPGVIECWDLEASDGRYSLTHEMCGDRVTGAGACGSNKRSKEAPSDSEICPGGLAAIHVNWYCGNEAVDSCFCCWCCEESENPNVASVLTSRCRPARPPLSVGASAMIIANKMCHERCFREVDPADYDSREDWDVAYRSCLVSCMDELEATFDGR